jgi:hypothetical protein
MARGVNREVQPNVAAQSLVVAKYHGIRSGQDQYCAPDDHHDVHQ